MMWVFAILIVLALGGVALVAAGIGSPMGEEYGDRPDASVPADRPLRADDLRRVRFSVGWRGYRMDEVDALLARLAAESEDRERYADPEASEASEPEPLASETTAPEPIAPEPTSTEPTGTPPADGQELDR